MLKSLLSGHEVQLPEGAFGTISERILRLFTEVKCNLNEQSQDLDSTPIVSIFCVFWNADELIWTSTTFFQTLPDPVEKEFTLRVCGQTSHAIGVGGPQFLRYVFLEEKSREK